MNSPMSHPFKKFEGINASTNITHGSIDEAADEELKGIHNSTNGDEDESPYSSGPLLVEGRTSICDEIMKFDSSPSPFRAESNWSDTTSYVAKKKLHSWFQLPDGNWELAKILSTSGVESLISLPDGKVSKVNSESLLPANPDILDGVDDLMQLSYLNEPSVLNNLHYRYNCDMVYTKAGPVLVAINPFKEVPLYGNDYIEAYKHKSIESPHVYAITDTAMRQMIRELSNVQRVKGHIIYSISFAPELHLILEEALDAVHVSKEDQESVFAMLAAVLWLGNISFFVVDNESHVEAVPDEGLTSVAKLIGCNVEELKLALSSRKLRVGNDTIVQKLILSQAIDTRDALAKSIYSSLFDWLVEQINKSLAIGKRRTGRSISILDIYGFESFDKPLGLLSLLDEESTFPNGTDLTFANKLKQHLNHNSCFKGERGEAFTVCHYAGDVMYETTGFLEKNRDLLHLNTIQLLASCTCRLPQTFASNMLSQTEKPVVGSLYKSGGADSQRLSVVLKFKGQLFKLMQRLENTTPHFIRCIKPNNSQSPGVYQQGLVLHQLRCCGVLEVVRISKSGFPTRMSHQKFARRYGFLLLDNVASQDPLSVSVAILHQFNIPPEMYQVGYTKLFFRTGQIGVLEDTTNRTLLGILRVQSCFRGHKARRYLKELRRGIATLQSLVHGEKTRKEYEVLLQRHRAALLIQKEMKGSICRKKFKNDNNPHEVPVDPSILAELQRRILKAEAASREKEEENDIIRQQIQHYDNRWSEYELKMKSMEETWQKQMRSLQSSLSISKKSMSLESSKRNSNASVNTKDDRYSINGVVKPMSAGLSVINRLAEEFEQRRQVFRDDAKFLVEVKSGEVEASLDPERELRWLKQMFEDWKKDYGTRLRETKLILHKLGDEGGSGDKVKNKWWGSRNSSRMIN
ncbi:hypothetical protein LguiB_025410 [Lonicera macranthoides]